MSTKPEKLAVRFTKKYPLTFTHDFSEDDPELSKRYEEAWKVAKKAAALLKKGYGAKKVAVFGSLVHRSQFTPWSDVDIAVWEIPDNLFYAAVGAVTGLSKEIKVDLVDTADCRDSLRKAIEVEGKEI